LAKCQYLKAVKIPLMRTLKFSKLSQKHLLIDVFDTCLTRIVINPKHAFIFLGNSLLKARIISKSATKDFQAERVLAESNARNANASGECTLTEIHKQLQKTYNWNDSQLRESIDLEFSIEKSLSRPIAETAKLLKHAAKVASSINFVSDTYFNSSEIRRLLKANDMWCNDAKVYSSCEYRKSKSNRGELFQQILLERQFQPDQVLHIGNDYKNDIRNPSLLKINTLHFTSANPTHWDNLLISKAKGSNQIQFVSFLLGSARLSRLNGFNGFQQDEILIATTVIAPLIFSYCKWVMQEARRLSLKKLFFISRDGEILMEICNLLKQKKTYQKQITELRYLFGSRQAWNFPCNEQELDFQLIETFKSCVKCSLSDLLDKHFPENDLREKYDHFLKSSFKKVNFHSSLTSNQLQEVRSLFQSPEGINLASQTFERRKQTLNRYLQQEGVFGSEKFALVDLGWNGTGIASVIEQIQQTNFTLPEIFFFGRKSNQLPSQSNNPKTFLFDRVMNSGWEPRDIPLSALLEIFCYSSQGRTLGYQKKPNQIEPIFDCKLQDSTSLETIKLTRTACQKLTKNWPSEKEYDSDVIKSTAEILTRQLRSFYFNPPPAAIKRWGSFNFDFDALGSDYGTLSERFNFNVQPEKPNYQVQRSTKTLPNSFTPRSEDRVIIFGASEAGQKAYKITTKQAVVIAFADNDIKKHGSNFCDVPVISPEQISSLQFSVILIASMYAKEIHAQLLLELGLEYEKVHLFEMQD